MDRRFVRWGWVAIAAAVLAVAPAGAATDEEIFRDIRFNFINPGGRSLGMGGAFVALADDATAAQANPAGLARLAKPEFFGEFRFAKVDSSQITLSDVPNGGPYQQDIAARTAPSSDANPSFLAYVIPFRRASLGFSRQELLNWSASADTRANVFLISDPTRRDELQSFGTIDLRLVNYNASLGLRFHDTFSVGVTATFGQLTQESFSTNLLTDTFFDLDSDPDPNAVAYTYGAELFRTNADDSDSDITFTAGFLWVPVEAFSVGGVWRQGGEFSVSNTISSELLETQFPGFLVDRFFGPACGVAYTQGASCVFQNNFNIPDSTSLGVAWRPTSALTLSLEANKITYSDLVEGFQPMLNVLNVNRDPTTALYTVDDQTNIHFGLEWVKSAGKNPIALRLGYHQDKDNRIRAIFPDIAQNTFFSNNATFPGRDDLDHFTAGIGAVIGGNFQIDIAVDWSDDTTEAVASFIHRF